MQIRRRLRRLQCTLVDLSEVQRRQEWYMRRLQCQRRQSSQSAITKVRRGGLTGWTHPSNRSADDQRRAVLGHCTDQATELKDEDGHQEHELEVEVLVGFSPTRLN